jgi:hypothetical protein
VISADPKNRLAGFLVAAIVLLIAGAFLVLKAC